MMYRSVVKKLDLKGESAGVTVASVSAVLGIVMGAIGTKIALS
jgi:hypothetical protein